MMQGVNMMSVVLYNTAHELISKVNKLELYNSARMSARENQSSGMPVNVYRTQRQMSYLENILVLWKLS